MSQTFRFDLNTGAPINLVSIDTVKGWFSRQVLRNIVHRDSFVLVSSTGSKKENMTDPKSDPTELKMKTVPQSVTQLTVPLVAMITAVAFIIGILSTFMFTAGSKSANLDSLTVQVNDLKSGSDKLNTKIDTVATQVNTVTTSQALSDQKLNTLSTQATQLDIKLDRVLNHQEDAMIRRGGK